MHTYTPSGTDLQLSRIAYGCMKLGGAWTQAPIDQSDRLAAQRAVAAALEAGINVFDHADIYTHGKSETVFGELLQASPALRANMVLQSKAGIRFAQPSDPYPLTCYDFSFEHLMDSVHASLKRLHTDYLDIFLLHRPDALVEPEEVARAFDALHRSGAVRHFGVANHSAAQMALLRRYVRQPLIVNQLELSLGHVHLINEGLMANRLDPIVSLTSGTLDACRAEGVLIQAWGPLANGRLSNPAAEAPPAVRLLSGHIAALAEAKNCSPEAILLAWLLRHPAGIQPIIGTTHLERIKACCVADTIQLTRQEWYALFVAARGEPLP